MERYMILAVPMTQWSWLEDVLEPNEETGELEPTGAKVREYGLFWNWLHTNFDSSIITPSFQNLISETPLQMLKGVVTYGVEIMPISRFTVGDYDTWANGLLTAAVLAGVDITATTCLKVDKAQWFADNGFEFTKVE